MIAFFHFFFFRSLGSFLRLYFGLAAGGDCEKGKE
jgi:hypothetical protein